MLNLNFPAIRAADTALRRSARVEAQIMGWEADRQYDGGEWSDDFHSRSLHDAEFQVVTAVAKRFQLEGEELMSQIELASYYEQGRMIEVLQARR